MGNLKRCKFWASFWQRITRCVIRDGHFRCALPHWKFGQGSRVHGKNGVIFHNKGTIKIENLARASAHLAEQRCCFGYALTLVLRKVDYDVNCITVHKERMLTMKQWRKLRHAHEYLQWRKLRHANIVGSGWNLVQLKLRSIWPIW